MFFRGTRKKDSFFVVRYCPFVETVGQSSHKTCRGNTVKAERQSSRRSNLVWSAFRRSWYVIHDTTGRKQRSPLLSYVKHQHNTGNTTKIRIYQLIICDHRAAPISLCLQSVRAPFPDQIPEHQSGKTTEHPACPTPWRRPVSCIGSSCLDSPHSTALYKKRREMEPFKS